MSNEITFPRLGWDMQEGVFGCWLVDDGAAVEEGQAVFTVESEKASVDIESLDSGILRIDPNGPQQGETVKVGAVLGYILEETEAADFQFPETKPGADVGVLMETPPAPPSQVPPPSFPKETAGHTQRVFITPLARKIAGEEGLDILKIRGTGRNSRIVRRDVEAQTANFPEGRSQPMSASRRITADRMARSSRETAPVTLFMEVNVSHLVKARNELKQQVSSRSLIPSYDDFFILLSAKSLKKFPDLNSSLEGQTIVQHRDIHIGFAVDTGDRLLVPVIRDADQKKLSEITEISSGLVHAARSGKLSPSEMQGARFTITNLGAFNIYTFTPIINLPECAILGLGRINTRFEPQDERGISFTKHEYMMLSLTFDHRLVDGAGAARFLQHLGSLIEHPISLIIT
jgi:pyruvate dehydrogenase E2 component (dihydrolipoamide acetyltransferase)